MVADLLARRPSALEHVLHHVDAAARRVPLVAKQHICRANGRAQTAMHAPPEDPVDLLGARVLQLGCREVRLHRA